MESLKRLWLDIEGIIKYWKHFKLHLLEHLYSHPPRKTDIHLHVHTIWDKHLPRDIAARRSLSEGLPISATGGVSTDSFHNALQRSLQTQSPAAWGHLSLSSCSYSWVAHIAQWLVDVGIERSGHLDPVQDNSERHLSSQPTCGLSWDVLGLQCNLAFSSAQSCFLPLISTGVGLGVLRNKDPAGSTPFQSMFSRKHILLILLFLHI